MRSSIIPISILLLLPLSALAKPLPFATVKTSYQRRGIDVPETLATTADKKPTSSVPSSRIDGVSGDVGQTPLLSAKFYTSDLIGSPGPLPAELKNPPLGFTPFWIDRLGRKWDLGFVFLQLFIQDTRESWAQLGIPERLPSMMTPDEFLAKVAAENAKAWAAKNPEIAAKVKEYQAYHVKRSNAIKQAEVSGDEELLRRFENLAAREREFVMNRETDVLRNM